MLHASLQAAKVARSKGVLFLIEELSFRRDHPLYTILANTIQRDVRAVTASDVAHHLLPVVTARF